VAVVIVVVGIQVGVASSRTPRRAGGSGPLAVNAPTVTSVSPAVGPARGGTRIVVHGTRFAPGMVLLVGNRPARILDVANARAVVAVTPAGFGAQSIRAEVTGARSRSARTAVFRYGATVLVVGDSLGIDLGWGFTDRLPDGAHLDVLDRAVGSTGLVRTDYYDWPSHLSALLDTVHPDVVVTLFGTNDEQPISTRHGDVGVLTPAWDAAYASRVRQVASLVAQHGATLAWVSLPRMGPSASVSNTFVDNLNATSAAALRSDRGAVVVVLSSLFTSGHGVYSPYVHLPSGGLEDGRQPDGVHLTPAGATAIDDLALASLLELADRPAH
jgi:hypothetical protein